MSTANTINNEKYDYKAAVRADIEEYLGEHTEGYINKRERDRLYDSMFVSDYVTGNGSGSYTFNAWRAESYLCHNEDLREECAKEFGIDTSKGRILGAEYWDVSIRCMLLGQLLYECIEKWNEAHPETDEDADDAEQEGGAE